MVPIFIRRAFREMRRNCGAGYFMIEARIPALDTLPHPARAVLYRVTITNWGTAIGSVNYGLATAASGM